jgi:hypothetical protein
MSNFKLRPLCPEYNPGIHSIVKTLKPWSRSRPRKRRRLSANNELDSDLGATFAQMEMIGAGEAMTRADGADGVSTGPDGVLTGADGC